MEWHDGTKFVSGHDVDQTIAIDGEVYYTHYKCIADSDGEMTLILSPNLEVRLKEGVINFKASSTVKEIGRDAKFLLKLINKNTFEVQGNSIRFTEPKITADFVKRLKYIADLYDTLEMIGFGLNTQISQYTDEQQAQLVKLVNMRLGAYNNHLQEGINRYNWKFGDKYFPLLVCKNDEHIDITSSLYTEKYVIFLPASNSEDDRGYKMPMFIYNDIDVLCNLYFCDYRTFYRQIDDSDINNKTADALIECALIMINVYDQNSDVNFLELAEYMLNKLEPYAQRDLLLLNKMQIKKRKNQLGEEDLNCIRNIDSDNIQILFGVNVLLEDKKQAKKFFDRFTKKERERYMKFPIYKLYCNL